MCGYDYGRILDILGTLLMKKPFPARMPEKLQWSHGGRLCSGGEISINYIRVLRIS